MREVSFKKNPFGNADSSVLYEQGNTKVFVTVGLVQGVPKFLKNTGKGWLTAEYAMHPYACDKTKKQRENFPNPRDGRSVEISRFLGRVFRSVVDCSVLGEKTLNIDCDVLQADGGTRTAAVTAASLALSWAQSVWLSQRQIKAAFLREPIFGISAGVVNNKVMLDLDKDEDSSCEADFNFVMTKSGMLVEVQGTSEGFPIPWHDFDDCRKFATEGIKLVAEKTGF